VSMIILMLPRRSSGGSESSGEELARWIGRQGERADSAQVLLGDFRRIEAKLRVASADIYGDYDRLRSEGELRINMAPAVAALSVVLGIQLSLWFLVGVFVAIMLFWQGTLRFKAATDLAYQALMAGVIHLV
jgi:hypothetical protein